MKSVIILVFVSLATAIQDHHIQKLFDRASKLDEQQDTLQKKVTGKVAQRTGTYAPSNAFTARPSDNNVYEANEIVRFDSQVLNNGGSYNTTTSEYTCDSEGVYMFSVTVDTGSGSAFRGRMVKRELSQIEGTIAEVIVEPPSDANTTVNVKNNGMATTLVNCLTNEVVFMRSAADCTNCQMTRNSRFTGSKLGGTIA